MIRVTGLEKKFDRLTVLRDITCEIHEGEAISIIGPSGTGKSTFLRCLNLLEKPTRRWGWSFNPSTSTLT